MIRSFLFWLSLLGWFFLNSCQQGSSTSETPSDRADTLPQTAAAAERALQSVPLVSGWMPAVQLEGVETSVEMGDYFSEIEKIDSVTASMGIQAELSPDKQKMTLRVMGDPGSLSTACVWAEGEPYDILLKSSVKKRATLRLRDQGFKKVMIKGDMNAWDPQSAVMSLNNGIWEYTFELEPGPYQYLFVVDGKEMMDPKNPLVAPNGKGGNNSLLSLKTASASKLPRIYPLRAKGNTVQIGIENPGAVYIFWENRLLERRKEGNTFSFEIPESASTRSRSFVRAFGQNEYGTSNDLLIPLDGGAVMEDPASRTRGDQSAQILYFTDVLYQADRTLALGRSDSEGVVVAVFNNSDASQTCRFELPERFAGKKLNSHFGGSFTQEGRTIEVQLAPNSFDYLMNP